MFWRPSCRSPSSLTSTAAARATLDDAELPRDLQREVRACDGLVDADLHVLLLWRKPLQFHLMV